MENLKELSVKGNFKIIIKFSQLEQTRSYLPDPWITENIGF